MKKKNKTIYIYVELLNDNVTKVTNNDQILGIYPKITKQVQSQRTMISSKA